MSIAEKILGQSARGGLPEDVQDHDTELRDLRGQDAQRIARMMMLRDVMGQFRRDSEVANAALVDYGRQVVTGETAKGKHDIRLPYMLAIAIKHTHRAASKVPDVRVDRGDQSLTEQFRQFAIERYLAACWSYCDAEVQVQDGAWDASTTGATAYEVEYDVSKQIGHFYARDPAGIIVVPDPITVWPYRRVYRSWSTPMASVKAAYEGQLVNPLDTSYGYVGVEDLVPDEGGDPNGWRCTIHEVITPQYKIRWCGSVELHRHVHNFGITPWVVHPNIGPRRALWGFADLELIMDAAIYYQALMSRQADVAAFASRGVFTEMNTGHPAEAIKETLSTGGVIPIRENSAIEPVKPMEQPSFVEQHSEASRKWLSELGFVPFAGWSAEAAGGMTSGTERGMSLQPSVELAKLKQGNMAWGLERVNEIILRIAEAKISPSDGLTYRGRLRRSQSRMEPFRVKLGGASSGDGLPKQFQEISDTSLPTAIDGQYETNVVFTDRLDMYDPTYVQSELTKFSQSAQSLRTTLENTGCTDPDNEIEQIAAEAEKYPWLRQGMNQLVLAQIAATQQQGGQSPMPPPAPDNGQGDLPMSALSMGGSDGRSTSGFDQASRAVNGSEASGRPDGAVPGVPGGGY